MGIFIVHVNSTIAIIVYLLWELFIIHFKDVTLNSAATSASLSATSTTVVWELHFVRLRHNRRSTATSYPTVVGFARKSFHLNWDAHGSVHYASSNVKPNGIHKGHRGSYRWVYSAQSPLGASTNTSRPNTIGHNEKNNESVQAVFASPGRLHKHISWIYYTHSHRKYNRYMLCNYVINNDIHLPHKHYNYIQELLCGIY